VTPVDADLTIVPVTGDEDVATWVEVHNIASPCTPEGVASTLHWWQVAPDWRASIAWRGDRPVGIAHVEVPHWSPDSRYAEAVIIVALGERRRGVGTSLFGDTSRWAQERGLAGLDVWVYESDRDAPAYWGQRGFREVEREQRSRVDLASAPATDAGAPPPAGIAFVTLDARPDLERGMYDVAREAWADIPGSEGYDPGDFAHWRAGELRQPGVVEDCGVIALADDRVVGYAILVRNEGRPEVAEHWMTAVARAWRGRGIATAMKREQIRRAPATGLTMLEAANERRNAGMVVINERLGYRPLPASIKLRGPLLLPGTGLDR